MFLSYYDAFSLITITTSFLSRFKLICCGFKLKALVLFNFFCKIFVLKNLWTSERCNFILCNGRLHPLSNEPRCNQNVFILNVFLDV